MLGEERSVVKVLVTGCPTLLEDIQITLSLLHLWLFRYHIHILWFLF
jgi:hypothetical protein